MLYGLVAVSILSHVHNLHFALFVYHALFSYRGNNEGRVHHVYKVVASAHQVDEALWVVEHAPGPVPCVALGKRASPVGGVEGCFKLAVAIFSAHQVERWVKHVAIVHGAFSIYLYFFFGAS